MKKIWKLNTGLTESENRKFVTMTMSKEDHDSMLDLELDLSIDLLEDDIITSFIISDDINIEKVKSLLSKYNLDFKIDDVTNFFINEQISIENVTEELIFSKLNV
jgi:hypothetical protein